MKILKTVKYKKLAAKRGSFKYKCDDCGESTYLAPRDRNRASIPRCRFCGSTWLNPITEYGEDRTSEGFSAYRDQVEDKKRKQNFV